MKIFALLLTLIALSVTAIGQKPSSTPAASNYKALVAKVRAGDKNVNFGELRRAYIAWINEDPKGSDAPDRDKMVAAFDAKEYAKAAQLGDKVADYEFVNSGLLRAIAHAYRQSGNEPKAKFFDEVAERASHSVYLSGDGKTAKTAFYVMNIGEEYRLMREFGYTVSSQSLLNIEGQSYDLLEAKDEKGNAVSVYFNICAFFACSVEETK
jgi:hypothetical protein